MAVASSSNSVAGRCKPLSVAGQVFGHFGALLVVAGGKAGFRGRCKPFQIPRVFSGNTRLGFNVI